MAVNSITNEQLAYVLAHLNDRPRTAVARAAGISMSCMYKQVRKYGGLRDHHMSRRSPESVRIVRELYPTTPGNEIDRLQGWGKGRANGIARDIGVEHNAETKRRIRECQTNGLRKVKPERLKEAGRRLHVLRRIEEMRVMSGQPQQTRIRLKTMPLRCYSAKWHLCRHYGYYECEGEPYTLLYDEKTRRRLNTRTRISSEEYYTKTYGLRFESL